MSSSVLTWVSLVLVVMMGHRASDAKDLLCPEMIASVSAMCGKRTGAVPRRGGASRQAADHRAGVARVATQHPADRPGPPVSGSARKRR